MTLMQIEFLGGAKEVGGVGISVSSGKDSVCLDYGMMVADEPKFPLLPSNAPRALILSHAHLDHVGAAPVLWKKGNPALACNRITYDMARLLIEDAMKISKMEGTEMPYWKDDYKRMKKTWRDINFSEKTSFGGMGITTYPAGHIPGAAGVLVGSGGKRVFYSGDFKLENTRLVKGGVAVKADTLIIESTYAEREHPERVGEERRLVKMVGDALANGQRVVIPVFAVGRAQEVLLILEKYAGKIAFDGMARKVSQIAARYGEFLADPARLQRILKRVTWVKGEEERRVAAKRHPIIVTTAGMASGGPIQYYLRRLSGSDSRVIFVGYLPAGTPARTLMDTGIFRTPEGEFKVKAMMDSVNLSAHAGRSELFEMVRRVKPKQVLCIHGDNCEGFAKELAEKFRIEAYAPENGEVLRV